MYRSNKATREGTARRLLVRMRGGERELSLTALRKASETKWRAPLFEAYLVNSGPFYGPVRLNRCDWRRSSRHDYFSRIFGQY